MRRALLGVVLLALVVACKGPSVPHPLTNESRYLCCNLHYEKPEISDANYQVGTLVPFGTRAVVREVRRNAVTFEAAGHPPLTVVLKYGKDHLSMDDYLGRLLVAEDPRARLSHPVATRSKGKGKGKGKDKGKAEPAEDVTKLIEQGEVQEGMTHAQVLMALGYPPAHRTPSLDAPSWTYWRNRWQTFVVQFDGDRVSRVTR